MNPVLSEIYSTVLGGAPYVIAAYALIFAILMVYVIMTTMKLKNTEKKLDALEEHVEERIAEGKAAKGIVKLTAQNSSGAVGATAACRFFYLGDESALLLACFGACPNGCRSCLRESVGFGLDLTLAKVRDSCGRHAAYSRVKKCVD